MKRLTVILTLILNIVNLNAQTWAPKGAKWTFEIGFATNPYLEFREWISIGDTLVSGKLCTIIQNTGTSVIGDYSHQLITYEDSNRVYWYNKNQFTILYDFNKNTGETWTTMEDTCEVIVTVDSTSFEIINGFTLKVQYISTSISAFRGKVLQYIGHLGQPNPDFSLPCYNIQPDGNYYRGLRCYQDTLIGYYNFGISPSCEYTTTGTDNLENTLSFQIYPNPTSNYLTIAAEISKELEFKIYNSLGQLIKEGVLNSRSAIIYIDELNAGLYTLKLNDTTQSAIKYFIVEN
jgi:hypothetical protein